MSCLTASELLYSIWMSKELSHSRCYVFYSRVNLENCRLSGFKMVPYKWNWSFSETIVLRWPKVKLIVSFRLPRAKKPDQNLFYSSKFKFTDRTIFLWIHLLSHLDQTNPLIRFYQVKKVAVQYLLHRRQPTCKIFEPCNRHHNLQFVEYWTETAFELYLLPRCDFTEIHNRYTTDLMLRLHTFVSQTSCLVPHISHLCCYITVSIFTLVTALCFCDDCLQFILFSHDGTRFEHCVRQATNQATKRQPLTSSFTT